MKSALLKLGIILVMGGLLWFPVTAHQQKEGLTVIKYNERSQAYEIMHRFYVHDAEHAAGRIEGPRADLIASKKTQQIFADYVRANFQIKINGKALPIKSVGYEIDGAYFWVYEEFSSPPLTQTASITNKILMNIWADQQNLVNVESNNAVSSLIFKSNMTVQSINLS
ncbi:hypothetical protein QGN29_05505 [Temperatibacter marinus]|uniref:Orphan protein n=1 Tax=Temperatibacter marinus TaxID=1456591 RepID=A0AA52EJW4_9PROT|nr:DUF6702 family protein [Temperatibacter marinus]WND03829.1 hypothetical protein QGN29_05505 [Temperatibacter marinus]